MAYEEMHNHFTHLVKAFEKLHVQRLATTEAASQTTRCGGAQVPSPSLGLDEDGELVNERVKEEVELEERYWGELRVLEEEREDMKRCILELRSLFESSREEVV